MVRFHKKTYGSIVVFWYKDFDGMAWKTMLRQLISKWGIMSIEMQEAFEKDMAEDKKKMELMTILKQVMRIMFVTLLK